MKNKPISIREKLIKMQLLAAFVILIASTVGFLLNDVLIFKRSIERGLESTARILGQNLASTFDFSDHEEATKILGSLQSETLIIAAYVYDKDGHIFAKFERAGKTAPAVIPDGVDSNMSLRGDQLIFLHDFHRTDGYRLVLCADVWYFVSDYRAYGWVVIGVFLSALFMSFVLAIWMQRSLSAPIMGLARTAKKISRSGDYSLRVSGVRSTSVEEIQTLGFEFDQMLVQIEQKDRSIRQEKDAAETANQAKSIFLANISHELRTPMHGILSFARFGQQKIETATKEKLKSYFDEIYDSGSRLMNLLNDLLDLSKLEAGKTTYEMETTDILEVIQTVCGEMRAFAQERGLKIQVESQESSIIAYFDPARMMQVVRNILSNAIKFSKTATTILIKVEVISLKSSDDGIRCTIRNEGIGIPQEELATIFGKFVQSSSTKSGAGGTGLGLAICKEIVQQHGGRIWAESDPSGETRFIFELSRGERTRSDFAQKYT